MVTPLVMSGYKSTITHCKSTLLRWRALLSKLGSEVLCVFLLSNDPDKNYSNFYCSAAIRFPHIEKVVFSDQEFINRWIAGL